MEVVFESEVSIAVVILSFIWGESNKERGFFKVSDLGR